MPHPVGSRGAELNERTTAGQNHTISAALGRLFCCHTEDGSLSSQSGRQVPHFLRAGDQEQVQLRPGVT
jgi:hypothetical protein